MVLSCGVILNFHKKYTVKVKPGLIAHDTIQLNQEFARVVTLKPNQGFVRLPLFSATQNASGHRSFDVKTANLKSVRTRVKSLVDEKLIYALKGYNTAYEGHGGNSEVPFVMVPGKTIYDSARKRVAKLDHTETFKLDWTKINPSSEYGAYYICAEGESEASYGKTLGAQALVQVTDIGMAWKQNDSETLVYFFSIKDGTPKKEIPVRLITDESEVVASTKTDQDGIARFAAHAYGEKNLWLDAREGNDRHVMEFSAKLDRIGLWSFSIPYRYNGVKEGERRTLIFTDRDVYKPGEKVYLKCISRTIDSESLLSPKTCKAQLEVRDNRGRKLIHKQVTFSKNGTYNDEITLPDGGLGYHYVKIDFNDPEKEDERSWNKVSHHTFNVAEYKVNTFEVSMQSKDLIGREAASIPLAAKYYMGKPLSKAIVRWNAYSRNQYPRPEGFDDFRFGDRFQDANGFSENDEIRLGKDGKATIDLDVGMDQESPSPRTVSVRAEVTDINQQTITGSTRFTIHSSDFYIGIQKPDGIHRVGDTVPFMLATIDPKGKAYQDAVNTAISVEREIWTTVKVKGSDGKLTHRNEKHYDLKVHEEVAIHTTLEPSTGLPRAQAHHIKFDEAGDYVITAEAVDKEGRRVLTREKFRVIGAEEPAWAWTDVVSIDVTPDKKSYSIGDTAKLLVRSPIFGQALVTTERGGVKSTDIITISEYETVIDIPIKQGDAPNIFTSILLIRGSAASPHKYPTADYRLGYCQLKVEDPVANLAVTLDSGTKKYYIPGNPVEVSARVTNGKGTGVPGAEVTLYAVDEGILSLTGYTTPNPGDVFNRPFPLSVRMGQSLSELFPENPLERDFGNKGYVIGGGGLADNMTGNLNKIRKDFKAVAFWKPNLVTDQNGEVKHYLYRPG